MSRLPPALLNWSLTSRGSLPLERVFKSANRVLNLTFDLVGLAFRHQLGVADGPADGLLDAAFNYLRRPDDVSTISSPNISPRNAVGLSPTIGRMRESGLIWVKPNCVHVLTRRVRPTTTAVGSGTAKHEARAKTFQAGACV